MNVRHCASVQRMNESKKWWGEHSMPGELHPRRKRPTKRGPQWTKTRLTTRAPYPRARRPRESGRCERRAASGSPLTPCGGRSTRRRPPHRWRQGHPRWVRRRTESPSTRPCRSSRTRCRRGTTRPPRRAPATRRCRSGQGCVEGSQEAAHRPRYRSKPKRPVELREGRANRGHRDS